MEPQKRVELITQLASAMIIADQADTRYSTIAENASDMLDWIIQMEEDRDQSFEDQLSAELK